jgi:hypothetical protein
VRGRATSSGLLTVVCIAALAGCGGGTKQSAGEPAHTYKIKYIDLTFKPEQAVARPALMRIEVQNVDTRTIPDIAVTLDSFYYTSTYPELAADKRPVWVVEQGPGKPAGRPVESQAISPPGGGQTAYVNTWALGPLAPGATQTFEWKVVPVKAGVHRVSFEISAGLAGQAKATLPNGAPLRGRFRSEIAAAPPATHVDPSTGKVVAGVFPAAP